MPRIGHYWKEHGGIYAGIVRGDNADYHLIMAKNDLKKDMTWDAATEWASGVVSHTTHGFRQYRLPKLRELAIIQANLKDKCNDGWHWTCEDYPADKECAWVVAMKYGRHADARKTDACRARAVRTEHCE